MHELPEYAKKNRDAWTKLSQEFDEPGRKAWSSADISWGCFSVLESDVHILGDLNSLAGKDVIELGCGTGYVSAWLARLGAKPVGIDVTPAQLDNARKFQSEFGISFPLIEGNAESVPMPDGSFDFAISEYGASIWCDPYRWIPEASRLLRSGGKLIFLRNSTIAMLCAPQTGPHTNVLVRDWFGMHRIDWEDDGSVEFHLPTGPLIRLLRKNGFEIEDLAELRPPDSIADSRFEYISLDWSRRWPLEELWRVRKR